MKPNQKLELTWIGKGEEPKLEPRILIEQPEYSYGDPSSGNMLIQGDNLLALKALEQDYAGKVKCIFIDPPYNTGSAFEHYDDGIEHSQWLNLMAPRLKILRDLLSNEGSIWISIDDNEAHYLKVIMDEIFSRKNFVANVVWQKRTSPDMRATLGAGHDHILVYARNLSRFKNTLKPLPKNEKQEAAYKNPDKDPRGPWASSDYTAQGFRPNQMYKIITPAGAEYDPPTGRCWKNIETVFLKLKEDGRIWFGKDGKGIPRKKTYLLESEGQVAWSWWPNSEVGNNQEAKKEINQLFGAENAFDTPKPERLIERVVYLASEEGDIVLDSFLGSGTTAAVAHKMGRKWIGIELGEHAKTHCYSRLKQVVDGTDQGGISKAVEWQGGGGFRFYTLAPSLLNRDKYGNWIISKKYNPDMLAAAMAKQEGFRYQPDEEVYWKQARSSEKDFLFTTTGFMTVEMLDGIHEEMQPDESLLIACKAYQKECAHCYPNISIKKIPNMLLGRCEFGREDYSLNIVQVPYDRAEVEVPDDPELDIESEEAEESRQTDLFE
jgi:adenine-specific DNA-methyltransferase